MFAPDRQGFFPGLWVQFLQDLSNNDKEAFNSLTTKEERLCWMYNRPFVRERLGLMQGIRLGMTKDPGESVRKREEGNKSFQGGDLQSALVNYTRAVVLGEDNTTDLASALANRSDSRKHIIINMMCMYLDNDDA